MAAAGGNPVPFGNQAAIVDEARDLWRFSFLENLWRDVIYGARQTPRRSCTSATGRTAIRL